MNVCVRADCISMCEHSATLSIETFVFASTGNLEQHSALRLLPQDSKPAERFQGNHQERVRHPAAESHGQGGRQGTYVYLHKLTYTPGHIHTYIHSYRISFSRLKYSTNWTESAMVRTYLLLRMYIYIYACMSVSVCSASMYQKR